MILPNLFIPGAGKSGTSTLHEYLSRHPEIFMSVVKEVSFFSHDKRYAYGLKWYSRHFEAGRDFRIRGESSTCYMAFPKVIERIKSSVPEPKFIFILRNPIDRMYSHYWWLRGMGYEQKPFRDAMLSGMDKEPDPTCGVHGLYKFYYQSGCYAKWLCRFVSTFGQDAVLVITTEGLHSDKLSTLNKCCSFLGIIPFEQLEIVQVNETVILKFPSIYRLIAGFFHDSNYWLFLQRILPRRLRGEFRRRLTGSTKQILSSHRRYPKMSDKDRAWVASLYTDEVDKLRHLIGMKFEEWTSDFPMSCRKDVVKHSHNNGNSGIEATRALGR